MIPLPRILAKRCAMLSTRFRRFQWPICWKGDIKNFAGWVSSQEVKALAPRLALDVMFGTWGKSVGVWLTAVAAVTLPRVTATASEFHFDRDTFAFANQTVFEYHEGHPSLRRGSAVKKDAYNRHCFVLCRTAMQFKKFARFDPKSAPLDDTTLAARIRAVTHQSACAETLPQDQRATFDGY